MDITFHPIGVIRSPYNEPEEVPKWGAGPMDIVAEIVMDEKYLEGLADVNQGEKYQVVFSFHKSKEFKLTVPIRGSGPMTGVFSTRSPNRPNSIGISVITVTAVCENRIVFTGVDMLDGTPVLDIKPYVAE